MRKIILSGGPHTGKTTLLDRLKEDFPNIHYTPEPATNVIEVEKQKEQEQKGYVGKFPWNNYAEFGLLVMAESVKLENEISTNVKTVILDRSLIDTVGYLRLEQCLHLVPEIKSLIREANYDIVLFCDFVGEYTANHIRHEDECKARLTHDFLLNAYKESGLELIHVPPISVDERVKIVSKLF